MTTDTYPLTLTRGQAVALTASVRIAHAATQAFRHGEWQPKKDADTKLLRGWIAAVEQAGASVPLNELEAWLRQP